MVIGLIASLLKPHDERNLARNGVLTTAITEILSENVPFNSIYFKELGSFASSLHPMAQQNVMVKLVRIYSRRPGSSHDSYPELALLGFRNTSSLVCRQLTHSANDGVEVMP